ncbi:MAG TPA: acyl-CoA dehydrogenase family protein [Actinomycetota bacterium]|jgi:alkylation response protein AidB-like acyl-CoA dehydrogenase|nr:acyl-CoA dehydrogenase family protein [Actinomycetota bacterium]
MDFELPAEHPARTAVREWIAEHPAPTARELADAGYVVPHWPKPWGLDADPIEQLLIADELKRAGISRPINPIGIGHCGPILVMHGTDEQKQRYIPPMLSADEIWCQLFSEPGAGSDLAGVTTRVERTDDGWIVNGQKVWTSLAHDAAFGILLARTNADVPKHQGLSYFLIDMKAPGVEVRPLVEMTGQHLFNEVFFTDVKIPADALIGQEGNGWAMARDTLDNERVTLSRAGLQWGWGPTAEDLVAAAHEAGGVDDPVLRMRLVDAYIEHEIIRIHGLRMVAAAVSGRPGPEASLRKALSDPHGQKTFILSKDLAGTSGMLRQSGPLGADPLWWADGFLFAPALTIGGGTSEVLRNVIAERMLGLPREREDDTDIPWAEARRRARATP